MTEPEQQDTATSLFEKMRPYHRDNLLGLLRTIPEANTGDWYHELVHALEEAGADPNNANSRPKNLRAEIDSEINKLKQEIVRIHKEGVPGVMHEIDRDFYNIAIKERDAERHRVNRLTAEAKELKEEIAQLKQHTECELGSDCPCYQLGAAPSGESE